MIKITSIRNIKPEEFDETWMIMRSLKKPIKNTKQVVNLSPSTSLFFKVQNLKKENKWTKETFNSFYVPLFLQELSNNSEAIRLLNDLYIQDKQGKNICLACFCSNEELCHRSIIAGLLQGVGCNIITDTNNDYSSYWKEWRKLREMTEE